MVATEPDGFGGLSSLATYVGEHPLDGVRVLALTPHYGGTIVALIVGGWFAVTWARNHQRRGVALTAGAIVVVRGDKLYVQPLADIVEATARTLGARGKRFTVLTLRTTDGRKRDLYVNGHLARLVVERVAQRA